MGKPLNIYKNAHLATDESAPPDDLSHLQHLYPHAWAQIAGQSVAQADIYAKQLQILPGQKRRRKHG